MNRGGAADSKVETFPLPVPPPDDTIGKNIAGKYRVEQMIGEGGMGKVYKATQLALDKPVVLKVLRQALLGDERTVARFQREAKAASRLNHPNSISVLDFGQADDGATIKPPNRTIVVLKCELFCKSNSDCNNCRPFSVSG